MDLVAFLCDREQILSHKLHWIREENKGFPCLEPNCRLCPWPSQTRWYAPVLRYTVPLPLAGSDWHCPDPPYNYNALRWERRVLEITQGWRSILDQVVPGALFHLERVSKVKQSRTRFNFIGVLENIPDRMCFDVRPAVMNMWGLSAKLWE